MIEGEIVTAIRELAERGWGTKAIARELGVATLPDLLAAIERAEGRALRIVAEDRHPAGAFDPAPARDHLDPLRLDRPPRRRN